MAANRMRRTRSMIHGAIVKMLLKARMCIVDFETSNGAFKTRPFGHRVNAKSSSLK
jgi:hypothetical protein